MQFTYCTNEYRELPFGFSAPNVVTFALHRSRYRISTRIQVSSILREFNLTAIFKITREIKFDDSSFIDDLSRFH